MVETLDTLPAVALCGGAALYLLGHVAFLVRATGRIFRRRTLGAAILLAVIPAALALPPCSPAPPPRWPCPRSAPSPWSLPSARSSSRTRRSAIAPTA